MTRRVVLVALVVVLAGCSSLTGGTGGTAPTGGADGTDSAGASRAGTATLPDWNETELVVALEGTAGDGSEYASIVQSTLTYWENNATRYLGHPVQFRFEPDASNPDLVVRVVDSIDNCGSENHVAGCSPYVTDLRRYPDTVTIRIQNGFSRESTLRVTKHEFGHALGLDHDDEPASIMQSQAALAKEQERNASARPVPWENTTLSVYLDEANISAGDRTAVRQQVQHALDYYNDGAEGTIPSSVSFTLTSNRTAADISVIFPETVPCGGPSNSPQSCARVTGPDPDRDGARERYTHLTIYLSTMSTEAMGWHVGRWLGTGMGLNQSELADPFVGASYQDRRSEWWR